MHASTPATPRKRQFQQSANVEGSKAKRRLFSATTNSEEVDEYVLREVEKAQQEKQKQYNFDFARGVPLPSSSVGSYVYTSVPESEVPAFYRTRRDSGFDSSFDTENKSPDSDVSSADEVTFSPTKKLRSPAPKKRRMQSTATPKKDRRVTDFMPIRRKSLPISSKDLPRQHTFSQSTISSPVNSQ